jgi:hypothetical protein
MCLKNQIYVARLATLLKNPWNQLIDVDKILILKTLEPISFLNFIYYLFIFNFSIRTIITRLYKI